MLVNEGTNPNKQTIQGVPKKGVKNFLRLNALIKKNVNKHFYLIYLLGVIFGSV